MTESRLHQTLIALHWALLKPGPDFWASGFVPESPSFSRNPSARILRLDHPCCLTGFLILHHPHVVWPPRPALSKNPVPSAGPEPPHPAVSCWEYSFQGHPTCSPAVNSHLLRPYLELSPISLPARPHCHGPTPWIECVLPWIKSSLPPLVEGSWIIFSPFIFFF